MGASSESATRRGKLVFLLASGVGREDLASHLGVSASSVRRELAAIRRDLDDDDESNSAAAETTLDELERAGRFERVDAARVQAIRSMARALDLNPFNSQMWAEYREALERLMADDSDDGSLAALLDELRAPVRDS